MKMNVRVQETHMPLIRKLIFQAGPAGHRSQPIHHPTLSFIDLDESSTFFLLMEREYLGRASSIDAGYVSIPTESTRISSSFQKNKGDGKIVRS